MRQPFGTSGGESVRLLLQHHSDPDGRWCEFESRGTDGIEFGIGPCTAATGVTPLIMAALRDQADTTSMLLEAGANVRLTAASGANALATARGMSVFRQLLLVMFPKAATRDADALKYFTDPAPEAARRVHGITQRLEE